MVASKNSGPVSVADFPVDNRSQELMPGLHDPGNIPRDLQRQDCPAVEAAPPVEIVEQPAEESRFRYSRESRTNGSILGVSSTDTNKTYPSIRVNLYTGPVRVRVSCVSKDSPYRPHPHKIVGRENCSDGVYMRQEHIRELNQTLELKCIGIQCTKREQYGATLQERALMGVDPFRSGFKTPLTSNQSHYVRLAIEVFIPDSSGTWKLYGVALSDVITDLPTKLKIYHISQKYGSVYGGTQITLLTDRLPNIDQLVVRFQAPGWRTDVRPQRVHHLVSLVVNTPPYKINTYCTVPVTIHLVRPPTGDPDVDKHMVGEPCDYLYTPGPDYHPITSRAPKRQRTHQKPLHPALHPGYLDDPVSADSPPEPQPSTSTGNTDCFHELDQWFLERVHTPQTSQEIRQTQSNNIQQPSNMQSLTRNLEPVQREQYQENQLPRPSSISNSQTPQTLKVLSSSSSAVNLQENTTAGRQVPHTFNQVIPVTQESRDDHAIPSPQSKKPVNHSEFNNYLQQWRSPNLAQRQPLSVQNNVTTQTCVNTAQKNKRNHSQMADSSGGNTVNMEKPLLKTQSSQTDTSSPRGLERTNSQHQPSTQGIPYNLPHQQKQPPVASIFERIPLLPQNQLFLEIPPTDFESNMADGAAPTDFEYNMADGATPTDFESNMANGVASSAPQYPLVDITGQYSTPRSLDPHELSYFETTQREISWTEILSSASDEPWTYQQQVTFGEQTATMNSVMAIPQTNNLDIEILSLSDELKNSLNVGNIKWHNGN